MPCQNFGPMGFFPSPFANPMFSPMMNMMPPGPPPRREVVIMNADSTQNQVLEARLANLETLMQTHMERSDEKPRKGDKASKNARAESWIA